jgi:hypothetical protein
MWIVRTCSPQRARGGPHAICDFKGRRGAILFVFHGGVWGLEFGVELMKPILEKPETLSEKASPQFSVAFLATAEIVSIPTLKGLESGRYSEEHSSLFGDLPA